MPYVSRVLKTLFRSLVHTRRKIGFGPTARLLIMFLRIVWHIGWTTRIKIREAERMVACLRLSSPLRRTLLTELRAWSAIGVVNLIQRGFHVRWDKALCWYGRGEDELLGRVEGPFIVVANHNNSVEIVALMALLSELGISNLKFVAKIGLGKAPVVGYLLRHCGDALIHRSSQQGDLSRIFESGQQAAEDQGSFAIFPEGTRFLGQTPQGRFTRVGNPKVGGFRELVRAYPDTPILAVCFDWVNLLPGQGRTMADIGDYYHAHLRTTCRVFSPSIPEHADRSLEEIFAWFEEELTIGRDGADVVCAHDHSIRSSGAR